MRLDKILHSQGIGPRKTCQMLIQRGAVRVNGLLCKNIKESFNPIDLNFSVYGDEYTYQEHVYIALYKPTGYECSHQTLHHASVFELLPNEFNERGVQTVGRLDQDTTGLLLLSDDGQFIQALTHPKKHVGKVYVVTTIEPITAIQIQQLEEGVALRNETGIFKAHDVEQLDEYTLRMTIHQGVYHQVKRMITVVGNHVTQLHRSSVGGLDLPVSLEVGEWVYLTAEDRAKI